MPSSATRLRSLFLLVPFDLLGSLLVVGIQSPLDDDVAVSAEHLRVIERVRPSVTQANDMVERWVIGSVVSPSEVFFGGRLTACVALVSVSLKQCIEV